MNAIAATLDYAVRLITGFIVTPILVAGLGDTLYGVWRTLGNLTGYISAASGRPSQALKWTIASQQNSTDYEEKRQNVASALIVWLIFFPLLVTIGGVIVWFIPLWIKGLPVNFYWIVRLAAALLMVDMITTTLTDIPQSALAGENLGYKRMGLSALLVVLGAGLAVLALYLNAGLVGVAVAELTTTIFTGLFFLVVARKYISWFGIAKPTKAGVRQFFNLSGWFLVWRLVMQLMTASDLIILGVFATAQLVTNYSLTKYAPETLINIVAIVVLGGTPGLGGIIGAGDYKKAARVRSEMMLLTWLVTITIGTTILLWNRAFIGLWVGAQHYTGSLQNLFILVLITQFVLIKNDAYIIDLTLKLSRKVILGLVSSVVSIGLSSILVSYFNIGVLGLVLGLIAGRSILSVAYPFLIGRFLGVSLYNQIKGGWRPIIITVLLFLSAAWLESMINSTSLLSNSWINLIFSTASTAVVVAFIAFSIGLSRSQQKLILQRIRMVMKSTGS